MHFAAIHLYFLIFLIILNIIRVSFIIIPISPTNPSKDEKEISIPITLWPSSTPKRESGITLRAKKESPSEENSHVRIIKIPNRAKSKEIKISFFIWLLVFCSPFINTSTPFFLISWIVGVSFYKNPRWDFIFIKTGTKCKYLL